MNADFSKPYDPKITEEKIYQLWLDSGYFNPDNLPAQAGLPVAKIKNSKIKNYVAYMPLPNVTGTLHMGHALNNTIQDILIRYHRMKGYKTLWLPGTDHAGIATQYVVEKDLRKQNISRFELGREKIRGEGLGMEAEIRRRDLKPAQKNWHLGRLVPHALHDGRSL